MGPSSPVVELEAVHNKSILDLRKKRGEEEFSGTVCDGNGASGATARWLIEQWRDCTLQNLSLGSPTRIASGHLSLPQNSIQMHKQPRLEFKAPLSEVVQYLDYIMQRSGVGARPSGGSDSLWHEANQQTEDNSTLF